LAAMLSVCVCLCACCAFLLSLLLAVSCRLSAPKGLCRVG
jgi:hypothetical protein